MDCLLEQHSGKHNNRNATHTHTHTGIQCQIINDKTEPLTQTHITEPHTHNKHNNKNAKHTTHTGTQCQHINNKTEPRTQTHITEPHTHSKHAKVLADWFQRYRPSLSKTWQLEHLKAHCTIAVRGVNAIHEKISVGLEITNNPKQVRATKIYNKGELNLVVATKTISVAPAE